MSGHIDVYRGYRIRRMGDGFHVDYLRRLANPTLPRSFTWTDYTCPADLEQYIDLLLAGNQKQQRRLERQNLVQYHATPRPEPPVPDASPARIRMGLDWLAAIIRDTEPCVLPTHAWIELRTDRNGCDPAKILTQRSQLCPTPARRRHLGDRYHQSHMAGAMLAVAAGFWVFHGWGVRIHAQQLFCHKLVPRFAAEVVRFQWTGPSENGRYTTLCGLLTTANTGSREPLREAEQRGWLTRVTRHDPQSLPLWTRVSPQRLSAILAGDDVLRVPDDGLVRTRRLEQEVVPVAWNVRLVDAHLDPWHTAAIGHNTQLAQRDQHNDNDRLRDRDRRRTELALLRSFVDGMRPVIVPVPLASDHISPPICRLASS